MYHARQIPDLVLGNCGKVSEQITSRTWSRKFCMFIQLKLWCDCNASETRLDLL